MELCAIVNHAIVHHVIFKVFKIHFKSYSVAYLLIFFNYALIIISYTPYLFINI